MPKPTKKAPSVDKFLDSLSGKSRVDTIRAGKCVFCPAQVRGPEDFKDDLSKKEYTISGLCQKCQDEAFAPPEEE